ncbi:MAG: class 1 fructose-bisphosphatase [Deinococcota bacterium]
MPHRNPRMTLNRFLVERQRQHPSATGRFTRFMGQIGTVAKIISNYMRRAAIEGLIGQTGDANVQGEQVKILDDLGNRVFVEAFEYVDMVGMIVSEEMESARSVEADNATDRSYAVMVDPVDGSSNIDVNGIIGSIFSVHDIIGTARESCQQKGAEQVAAGYMIYGPSTVLVYTAGYGVHSFVLDHTIGEFVLMYDNITMPERGNIFSANIGNYNKWDKRAQSYTDAFMDESNAYSLRYSGALLADLHQILHRGGVYYYPAETQRSEGKLRLLYECAPLAMIAEQAGGAATDGSRRIMDIEPDNIHQRSPLFIGSKHEVAMIQNVLS